MASLPSGGGSLPLLFLCYFLFLIAVHSTTEAPGPMQCDDAAGNYTANSTFQANLRLLLASLSAQTPVTRYFNDTVGRSPDQVFGHAMCRGDHSVENCRECVSLAARGIVDYCPRQRGGTAWLDDRCLLKYAGESFFGSPTGAPWTVIQLQNVSDVAAFNRLLGELMDGLAGNAAYRSLRMFAAGEVNFTSFNKVYGLVQCSRDLAADACDRCLRSEISNIPSCCNGLRGAKLFTASCQITYDISPFYNTAAAAEFDTSPPPPQPSTPAQAPEPGEASAGNTWPTDKGDTVKKTVVITIPLLVVVASICIIFAWFWRRKQKIKIQGEDRYHEIKTEDFLVFDLETLKAATHNFSDINKLGEGGFGPVYKGKLIDGLQVAVKRLSSSSRQGMVELKNEVALVAKLHHRNLVKLLGCCLEREKLLVYEFLPNGSLDRFLFDPTKCRLLKWETRYKIIEGVARGLQYLHEDSRLKVIHRDLKASNILLDEDMNPKISDFGLAKLFGREQSEGDTSRIAGTYGYMAPEYVMKGHISTKSDVYSFGILVLEIVTGCKSTKFQGTRHTQHLDLTTYARQHWDKGDVSQLVDTRLDEACPAEEVRRCVQIGMLCAHDDPYVRPNMSAVVLMLSSQTVTLPSISALDVDETTTTEGDASVGGGEQGRGQDPDPRDARNSHRMSQNNVSITVLEPR